MGNPAERDRSLPIKDEFRHLSTQYPDSVRLSVTILY